MRLGLRALTAGLTLAGTTAIATPAAVETENLPTLTAARYVPGGKSVVDRTMPDYAQSKFASVRAKAEPFARLDGELCIYEHEDGRNNMLYFAPGGPTYVNDLRSEYCATWAGRNWNDQASSIYNRG
jgi:hypothetical protein